MASSIYEDKLHFVQLFHFCEVECAAGFDLTIRDPYFSILIDVFTNHIVGENLYFSNHMKWTEQKIMGFKPANKYRIIQRFLFLKNILIDDFQHHPFLYWANFLKISFFTVSKLTNCQDVINHSNIFLLFDLLWWRKSISWKEI